MSPQSRANDFENTSFDITYGEGELLGNSCPNAPSIGTLARAATVVDEERTSSSIIVSETETLSRKRALPCASSLATHAPKVFLASYGSAFLSGLFADIAEASEQPSSLEDTSSPTAVDGNVDSFETYLPCKKKSRATLASSPGRRNKSYRELSEATAVVSPQSKRSSLTIKLFDDQVRELQNLAFPSLPTMPISVSTSSCYCVTPRDEIDISLDSEQDSSSGYGWFVSTDEDESFNHRRDESSTTLCTSGPVTDLAFKANIAPNAENHDTEVQQALAADTIDDVLGDFF